MHHAFFMCSDSRHIKYTKDNFLIKINCIFLTCVIFINKCPFMQMTKHSNQEPLACIRKYIDKYFLAQIPEHTEFVCV